MIIFNVPLNGNVFQVEMEDKKESNSSSDSDDDDNDLIQVTMLLFQPSITYNHVRSRYHFLLDHFIIMFSVSSDLDELLFCQQCGFLSRCYPSFRNRYLTMSRTNRLSRPNLNKNFSTWSSTVSVDTVYLYDSGILLHYIPIESMKSFKFVYA